MAEERGRWAAVSQKLNTLTHFQFDLLPSSLSQSGVVKFSLLFSPIARNTVCLPPPKHSFQFLLDFVGVPEVKIESTDY